MKKLLFAILLFPVFADAQILRLNLIADTTTPPPAVSFPGSYTNFTWTVGTNSNSQNQAFSASHLLGDLTFTAPSFLEVSTDGTTWAGTAVYTPVGGLIVSATLYARGKNSASLGNYSDFITYASSGLTPVTTIPVTGTVVSGARGVDTVYSNVYTSQSTIDINLSTFTASYRIFHVFFNEIVPSVNGTSLSLETSADGTTFDNTAGNYSWFWSDFNSNNPSSTSAALAQISSSISNAAGIKANGDIWIVNPNSTSFYPTAYGKIVTGTRPINYTFIRFNQQKQAGIRMLPGSGTLSGKITVVGIK